MSETVGIVLAAGKGTRMKSVLPKVLHEVAGSPMLESVANALQRAEISDLICITSEETWSKGQQLFKQHPEWRVVFQLDPRGTGDAVASAAPLLPGVSQPKYAKSQIVQGSPFEGTHCLICTGDAPALEADVLRAFQVACRESSASIGVIGMEVPEPKGYGRLVCDQKGRLLKNVEEKDADEIERRINLVNTGVVWAETRFLFELLADITPTNKQGEFYLTDCFELATKRGEKPFVYVTNRRDGFFGINDQVQRSHVEKLMVERKVEELGREGVRFILPATSYVEPSVFIGAETEIGPGATLKGRCKIGQGCKLESNVYLHNVDIPDGMTIPASSRFVGTAQH